MATLRDVKRRDGTNAYQVSFRIGGVRGAQQASQTFDDKTMARRFQKDVEDAGHQWPQGWVRGQGYQRNEPPQTGTAVDPERTAFLPFAERYVALRSRVQPDTRLRYRRQVAKLDTELEGVIDGPVFIEDLTTDNISDWVNWRGEQSDGSPKTVANYHGLLFAVMESAKKKGLRTDNPCEDVDLPRQDDGLDVGNEKVFLTKAQFALLLSCMPNKAHRDFVTLLVSTGLRFSEATSLKVQDLLLDDPDSSPRVIVRRAWKRVGAPEDMKKKVEMHPNGRFYIGSPKSLKSRRRVTVAPSVAAMLREYTAGKTPDDLVFVNSQGKAIDHAHFGRDCWYKALAKAYTQGLTVKPRIHDLRHTHAAWLISDKHSLAMVRDRLGHDSITTTVDTYGGLLVEAHEGVDRTIEDALSGIAWQPVSDEDETPTT